MEDFVPLFVRLETDLNDELAEVIQREERDKTTIVKRALRDYIAKSKADAAKPAPRREKA